MKEHYLQRWGGVMSQCSRDAAARGMRAAVQQCGCPCNGCIQGLSALGCARRASRCAAAARLQGRTHVPSAGTLLLLQMVCMACGGPLQLVGMELLPA